MTEADWLACGCPSSMLIMMDDRTQDFIQEDGDTLPPRVPTAASGRQFRLLACALTRRAGLAPGDIHGSKAVLLAEMMADGKDVEGKADRAMKDEPASWAAHACLFRDPQQAAIFVSLRLTKSISSLRLGALEQCDLVRTMMGFPFRQRVLADLGLSRADDPQCVLSVATAAYRDRLPDGRLDPARLAVLSDCLEEAGCEDAGVLGCLRSPGPHYRGLWALDLCLSIDREFKI